MPVRDALNRLASLGLVELLPRRGARVLDISIADLRDTFVARIALEPVATKMGVEAAHPHAAVDIRRALEDHEAALADGDFERARQRHRDFHFGLYNASGSRWLLRAIQPVCQNSERYRFAVTGVDTDPERSSREHHAILAAFEDADGSAAEEAMRVHLTSAGERLVRVLAETRPALAADDRPGGAG